MQDEIQPSGAASRRNAVLKAAHTYLCSGALTWDSILTYDRLEELSGLDRAQIAKDFGSKRELIDQLVTYSLAETSTEVEWLDEMVESAPSLIRDGSSSLANKLQAFGDLAEYEMSVDRTLRAQMAIWSMAAEDDQVRDRLQKAHRELNARTAAIAAEILNLVDERGHRARPEITPDLLATLANALAEGLAIRAAVDPEAVPAGTTGLVYKLIFEGLLTPTDEDQPVGSELDDLGL